MPIRRVFLGWDRSLLTVAADYLIERFSASGVLKLGTAIVAAPGGRAGRRLEEILLEKAEAARLVVEPPAIITVGQLPEKLYTAEKPFADSFVQQLAWIEALRRTDPGKLKRLISSSPADADFSGWLALAEMLARLHRELAADDLNFLQVAQHGQQIAGFPETGRWEVLAGIQEKYLDILDGLDLWDLQTARLFAIRYEECRTDCEIILIGTADLNLAQRRILDQVADRVTALVFAPESSADRFDPHGCLRPDAWRQAVVALDDDQIEIVDSPSDQAAAVVLAIAGFGGRYAAEEITVGVPDESIVPHVQQQLRQCGLPARYGVGRPLSETPVCRFLDIVADYLDGARFGALAALVRHPVVHDWIGARGVGGDWLSLLDAYHAERLPATAGTKGFAQRDTPEVLVRVHGLVVELVAGFVAADPAAPTPRKPLGDWGQPILDLLLRVFGTNALSRVEEPDRTILAACELACLVLQSWARLAEQKLLEPSLTAQEAIRLVLRQLEGETIAPPADHEAIDLLGWLELPLDDAPALVITQFNDQVVPGALNADLFLPNRLRHQLGIEDNDRRWARDVYAMSVLAASRSDLRLIAGRTGPDGDPLTPSRLWFACDAETLARRVHSCFADRESATPAPRLPGTLRPGQRHRSLLPIPQPEPLGEKPTSMRVTEFRDYLACPYRYYLRHHLHLQPLSDAVEELDAAAFGSLAHAVLGRFGTMPAAASTDVEEIRLTLNQCLASAAARFHGNAALPPVRVQIEQLRVRLMKWAQWQADWIGQGWRIAHVEKEEGGECRTTLVVDGEPMEIRGRIDRIDVNQRDGSHIVFDYKTGDTAKTPEQAHQTRDGWVDLQLPLYRHLAAELGITGEVRLGYIVLPKDTSQVGQRVAEWTEDDLRDADETARDVIRHVWAGRFWPPEMPPPAFSEAFAPICQDGQFHALADDDVEGGTP